MRRTFDRWIGNRALKRIPRPFDSGRAPGLPQYLAWPPGEFAAADTLVLPWGTRCERSDGEGCAAFHWFSTRTHSFGHRLDQFIEGAALSIAKEVCLGRGRVATERCGRFPRRPLQLAERDRQNRGDALERLPRRSAVFAGPIAGDGAVRESDASLLGNVGCLSGTDRLAVQQLAQLACGGTAPMFGVCSTTAQCICRITDFRNDIE